MRKSTEIVLSRAMNKIKENKFSFDSNDGLINWAQKILDEEIDQYFLALVEGIKQNSEKCEKELFDILYRRFSNLMQRKMYRDRNYIQKADGEDIVQNALKIVFEKCKYSEPKGSFIQWAQTILNNKYKEYRRKMSRERKQIKSLSAEEYEPIYKKRLSDVIRKRNVSLKTENSENKGKKTAMNFNSEENIFNDAVYRWHPVELSECEDLKNHLLKIVQGMGERCKKVFSLLFSTGDIKVIHEAFPDLSRSRIDVIISRCRKRLKQEAIKRRII
ncbi:MAG: hypothetical protein R6V04_13180 [bacterium]